MVTISTYKNIIIAVVIASVATWFYFYINDVKKERDNYKSENSVLREQIAYSKLEKERLETAIREQNNHIKQLELNEQLARSKLKKWKDKPPNIRFKTITKIREVQSNECKDIKTQLDSIKHTDFSSL